MRKSDIFFIYVLINIAIACVAVFHAHWQMGSALRVISAGRMMTQELGLTDLALFTEARFTRHLSQADLNAAFQEHPMCLEHFPTGAIVEPPGVVRKPGR